MTVGRNAPCPCGSGKKYKRCCLGLDRAAGAAGGDRSLPSEAQPFIAAAEMGWMTGGRRPPDRWSRAF
ncbi:MAG TPA: SEC-C metal-binding domain-containing protein [Thermoanaerobaculia bacterium]|nr:SEC-C metal-binding domain-containing protein [Thermoanaerobaculia bacterium]